MSWQTANPTRRATPNRRWPAPDATSNLLSAFGTPGPVSWRIFAHVLSLHPDTLARRAFAFLTGDPRRLRLGNHEDASGTSKRLVAQTSPKWSDAEVDAFVTMVNSYSPPPYPDLDAKGRQDFQNRLRIFRLGLLSALPPDRLPAASRRLVREEQRRFPRSNGGVRRDGPAWIGSPVSAEQLGKARDEDVLNAFREVPDKHEWDHPNRMMEGGNIQLSRAFAEFAKANPERAARLIRNFEPSFGTRAAGYAVEAIAEAGDAELVMRLILELDARGFSGEEFTSSASEAINRQMVTILTAVLSRRQSQQSQAAASGEQGPCPPNCGRGSAVLHGRSDDRAQALSGQERPFGRQEVCAWEEARREASGYCRRQLQGWFGQVRHAAADAGPADADIFDEAPNHEGIDASIAWRRRVQGYSSRTVDHPRPQPLKAGGDQDIDRNVCGNLWDRL